MITILLNLVRRSGNSLRIRHKLVNEPVLAQVIWPGCDMIILWMNSKPFSVMADSGDLGISTPPKPSEPCMWVAMSISPLIKWLEPLTTGICCLPMLYNKSRALRVVFYKDVFPADVERPKRLILSWWAARRMAMASSSPGSQSSQIGSIWDIGLKCFKKQSCNKNYAKI